MLLQIEKVACLIIPLFTVCTCITFTMDGIIYPTMVYLENQKGELMCAGTIINMQYILTVGTCVYEKRPEEIRMLLINGSRVEVESIKLHEEFKQVPDGKVSDNIAILKTKTDILLESSSFFKPLNKNYNIEAAIRENVVVKVINWFQKPLINPEVKTHTLRVTQTVMYNNETCSSEYKNRYDMTKNFCVVPHVPPGLKKTSSLRHREFCETYIGGPVVLEIDKKLDGYQIGIIEESSNFCFFNNTFPKLSTMIVPYLDWINENSVYINKTDETSTTTTSSNLKGRNKMKEKNKKNKKNNASNFRAFFCLKLAICVTVTFFNL